MKTNVAAGLLASALCWAVVAEEPPKMPGPQKEHEWLLQVAGEWETEGEIPTGPDRPPEVTKGSASGRMIGGFWAVMEHKGEVAGQAFTGMLTLGFDPEKKTYIGTWFDSMTSHLWHYTGTLDEAGRKLSLETEGPNMEKPGETVRIREHLQIVDKDHMTFTSTFEKDGAWITMLTIQYTRRK